MAKKKFVVNLCPSGDLSPANRYDRELLMKRYGKYKNKPLMITIVAPRLVKHNSKYWILLAALEFHFGNTDEEWHVYFKGLFLPRVEFYNPLTQERELHVSSTAFDKLDQAGFDEYYTRVDNWIIQRGYLVEELIDTMPRGDER